jgi:hypothetical protein
MQRMHTDMIVCSCLRQLLRPELVRRFPIAISSDVFSVFGSLDAAWQNARAREATRQIEQHIAALAKELDALFYKNCPRMTPAPTDTAGDAADGAAVLETHVAINTKKIMHDRGVNLRYLGHLRMHCQHPQLRQLLLAEMVARICRRLIQQAMRSELIDRTEWAQSTTSDDASVSAAEVLYAGKRSSKTKPYFGSQSTSSFSYFAAKAATSEGYKSQPGASPVAAFMDADPYFSIKSVVSTSGARISQFSDPDAKTPGAPSKADMAGYFNRSQQTPACDDDANMASFALPKSDSQIDSELSYRIRALVNRFFNLIFGNVAQAKELWSKILSILVDYYGDSLATHDTLYTMF